MALFRGSSTVEQSTVNRLVVGSNPTRGAEITTPPAFLKAGGLLSTLQQAGFVVWCG